MFCGCAIYRELRRYLLASVVLEFGVGRPRGVVSEAVLEFLGTTDSKTG
jgi:hypothetical protein